jgi:tetratricopeptide (TPR) repeat protein
MAKVSLRAYNREIETMIDRGHLDEAIAHCRHILKTFPKHLETYRLLGKAYLEYKRYSDAEDIFSRVLAAVPSDFVSHVGMSIIRDEENKLDEAIWHMERAFETQPSNAAIQSELQRLYSRRDGVQVPRIRMTRGALAHMYVQGELYPQAISEIKAVLKDDPGRTDMQVLLARAYYRSGAKNDAAEVASAVLRTDPYCLDANRVLVDILSVDRPESVQTYRQRVVELDPYAAQVSTSVFQSDEVPDAAVSIEHLDWNGQPVDLQPDWETRRAISREGSTAMEEQPDWLRGSLSETPPLENQTPPSPASGSETDIPDFLRAAGWGPATGAFDESKSAFSSEESESVEEAIAPGELPDWVKAMAPEEPAETPAEEEELPDWINQIGTSALPASSEAADLPDWMNQPEAPAAQAADDPLSQPDQSEPAAAQPVDDLPDWLKQLDQSEPSEPAASVEQPDWLKGFENETETSAPSTGELDWLSQLGEETQSVESSSEAPELSQASITDSGTSAEADIPDWLNTLDEIPQAESTAATASSEDFDFLNELGGETQELAPETTQEPAPQADLGTSIDEQEDAFAWLESLAAKQGATEGLLTNPEERSAAEEPEWVKQVKDQQMAEPEQPASVPGSNLEELGRSEQEQEDAFAWLESLATKQGATEGLLTQPEERREEEPEWVRQAKSVSDLAQEEEPSAPVLEDEAAEVQPTASLEDQATGEQDDTFAWLESLAKQQHPEEETGAFEPQAEAPTSAEQPASIEDTTAWLRSLDEEGVLPEPEPTSSKDQTAVWLQGLDEKVEEAPPVSEETAPVEALPDWMKDLDQQQPAEADTGAAVSEPSVDAEWMSAIEQEAVADSTARPAEMTEAAAEDIPSWLSELEQEEEQEQVATPSSADVDLPDWLREDTSDVSAEPAPVEPTRASDWQPVQPPVVEEEAEAEAEVQQPPVSEPVMAQQEEKPAEAVSEPPASQPATQPEKPESAGVVELIEQRIAAAEASEPPPPPPPPKPKLKGTGRLTMPLDPILAQARSELAGNNVAGALEGYARLIKKGRLLDEVIYDLREAIYRFPVDVDIWQSLGDAYMRANRLQEALDAYTKAEELLR